MTHDLHIIILLLNCLAQNSYQEDLRLRPEDTLPEKVSWARLWADSVTPRNGVVWPVCTGNLAPKQMLEVVVVMCVVRICSGMLWMLLRLLLVVLLVVVFWSGSDVLVK